MLQLTPGLKVLQRMDPLTAAHLHRAQTALRSAVDEDDQRAKAAAFVDAALAIAGGTSGRNRLDALTKCTNPLVTKAAAHLTLDDEWEGAADDLASAFLESIAERSIIEQLRRYGRAMPRATGRVILASDVVGDVVAEGDPKPTKHLTLTPSTLQPTKAVATIVMSRELSGALGREGRKLFENELRSSVARASNQSILSALTLNAPTVSSVGDPLADLRAGLEAAPASEAYVVAMPSRAVVDLSTRAEAGPDLGIRGGEFRPGISIVAIDGATDSVVIPVTRCAIWDSGLRLRSAGQAVVDMRDDPQAEPERISLWQAGMLGLLAERSWALVQADGVIVVEAGND